jgi:mannose-6-phosphate isomerase-like protein (cupin superfamily)
LSQEHEITKLDFVTKQLPTEYDCLAPDKSEIRSLPVMKGGGLCHCTLPAGKTSSPVAHRHVEEIWYILEGQGEVWRKNAETESIVCACAGTSLTIPPHTAFQFRNTGTGSLCIFIVTMPPCPGQQKAEEAIGVWHVEDGKAAEVTADNGFGGEGS